MKHLQFSCSLWDQATALPHFWEHTVGSGHAPLALRADWQQHLRECRTQLGFRHARFSHITSMARKTPQPPHRIEPGMIDRYLATAGYKGQLTREALPPNAPANLFEAVPGDYGAHGRFDSQTKLGSWGMFTDRHRTAFWAAAGIGAGGQRPHAGRTAKVLTGRGR